MLLGSFAISLQRIDMARAVRDVTAIALFLLHLIFFSLQLCVIFFLLFYLGNVYYYFYIGFYVLPSVLFGSCMRTFIYTRACCTQQDD